MKSKMRKLSAYFFLAMAVMSVVAGCGKNKGSEAGKYNIYCLDREENSLDTFEWVCEEKDTDRLAAEMLEMLASVPDDVSLKQPVHDFEVTEYQIKGNQIVLEVSEEYHNMQPTTEILVRAALVRSLCQIDGIEYVSINCHNEELTDALGLPVGKMNAEQFVDNEGNEINSYESVRLTLYFADENGKKLRKAVRTVEYNSNISMEKLVVEQLIQGSSSEDFRATINPQTRLINATVKDGICYISFDENFLDLPEGISPEISVFSVVNSLVELPNVNKVMISIDGSEVTSIGDSISIDTMFERNLELVE